MAAEEGDWETSEAKCLQTISLDQPHTPFPDGYSCMALMLLQQERNAETAAYQALAEERATVHRRDVTLIRMRLLNDQDRCEESRALAQDWLDARPYSIFGHAHGRRQLSLRQRFRNPPPPISVGPWTRCPSRWVTPACWPRAYARDDKALEARARVE